MSGDSATLGQGGSTSVHLRVMRQDDIPAGLRLCRASHWNQIARDWELFLALSPEGCRVAVDETGEVVGSVATVRYGNAFSWVAMVLVAPAHRRAGIGTRLLEEALILLDDVSIVRLDATPEGHDVYARAGFREESRLQRMQRARVSPTSLRQRLRRSADAMRRRKRFAEADANPMHFTPSAGVADHLSRTPMRPMEDGDIEEVLTWDQEAFGADRRLLLDAFRRGAPEYVWVTGHQQIDGYLFGRHGHSFEHLGPLVARDEDAARRLVTTCLSAHPDRPFILDVPSRASWVGWLGSLHFTVQRPFIRMYRGDERPRERPDQVFAIAGPEFG